MIMFLKKTLLNLKCLQTAKSSHLLKTAFLRKKIYIWLNQAIYKELFFKKLLNMNNCLQFILNENDIITCIVYIFNCDFFDN